MTFIYLIFTSQCSKAAALTGMPSSHLFHQFSSQLGAAPVSNIPGACNIFQIGKAVVCFVVVFMINVVSIGAGADKGFHDQGMNRAFLLGTVFAQSYHWVTGPSENRAFHNLRDVITAAGDVAPYSPVTRDGIVSFIIRHIEPLFRCVRMRGSHKFSITEFKARLAESLERICEPLSLYQIGVLTWK